MTDLYFAYGSNLDLRDLAAWCRARDLPPVRMTPICQAFLPDRRPAFTRFSQARQGGILDVPPSPGCVVPGMVFSIDDPQTWATLDRKEGAPVAYDRIEAHVLTADGRVVPVQTYELPAADRQLHVPPSQSYAAIVEQGFADFGLDPQWHRLAATGVQVSAMTKVFTYGTLLAGEPNAHLLGPVTQLATGWVPGKLWTMGDFPVLTPSSTDRVHGAVVDAPELTGRLAALDELEDFRGYTPESLYLRVLVTVQTPQGPQLAWAWRRDEAPAGAVEIPSGDWRLRHESPAVQGMQTP